MANIQPTEAAFSFNNYSFDTVKLDFSKLADQVSLHLDFTANGIYYENEGRYELRIEFSASPDNDATINAIEIVCNAGFSFQKPIRFQDIPPFFFSNSIAIIFPYIRAFVSTLTIQANHAPIVLPTLNVTPLKDELIKNSLVINGADALSHS